MKGNSTYLNDTGEQSYSAQRTDAGKYFKISTAVKWLIIFTAAKGFIYSAKKHLLFSNLTATLSRVERLICKQKQKPVHDKSFFPS